MKTKGLSAKKERAAQLMALGRSVTSISQMIDAADQTIWRWQREDFRFRERVRSYRQEIFNATLGNIVAASSDASAVLLEIAKDKEAPHHARVSAAAKILDVSKIAYEGDIQGDLEDLKESFLRAESNEE